MWEEQMAVHWTTRMNMQWVHESQGKVRQIIGADWEEKGHKGGGVDRKMGVVPTYRRVPKSSS